MTLYTLSGIAWLLLEVGFIAVVRGLEQPPRLPPTCASSRSLMSGVDGWPTPWPLRLL